MIKHIFDYVNYNTPILIAYSGGLDSTVLLFQCLKLKKINANLNIRAIHVNHNINPESKNWEIHCKNQCEKINVPITIVSINTIIKNNIQSTLRNKRYSIFKQHIHPKEILLTGHHLDDQAETVLLALKRGSGTNGLKGIVECSNFNQNKIIRPLLKINKQAIYNWAKKEKLSWIVDKSNYDTTYDRNFLRHQVIPILNKRWSSFSKNCATTAEICKKTEITIKKLSKKLLSQHILNNFTLNISNFDSISRENRDLILREWIYINTNKNISYVKTQQIYKEIIKSRIDANPKITFYKYQIRKYKNVIYCINNIPSLKNLIIFWHNPLVHLKLPYNLGTLSVNYFEKKIPTPKKNTLVNIRFQFQGKISIQGRRRQRKFKKILQELKIPTWKREQTPLLFYNNTLISALGLFVTKFKPCANSKFFNINLNLTN